MKTVDGVPLETVFEEAQRIVYGAREQDYGHPFDNHSCTANLWNTWWGQYTRNRPNAVMGPTEVCVFNIIQKLSRLATSPNKRDHLVDICGFAGNIERVQDYDPNATGKKEEPEF